MSSERQDWNTPECVLERVRRLGPILLDPCGNEQSIVGAIYEYGPHLGEGRADGLEHPWDPMGIVYVNPPYGREIADWSAKMRQEAERDCEIVALLPSRTDARWFQDLWTAQALCFWRGRLKFLGAPSSAPFPSVVAYWGPRRFQFAAAFEDAGKIVMP